MSVDVDKEQQISNLFDEMEVDLNYVGCTAIEDKLQEVFLLIINISKFQKQSKW